MRVLINKLSPKEIALILLLSGLFIHIIIKAVIMPFTFDEALTFEIFEGSEYPLHTANDHWLNTFLSGLCYKAFGNHEAGLRLPNVLAFILYGYGCFKLLRRQSWVVTFAGSALLLLNPYVLDFFSLDRGYGLGLSFFALSLVFFLKAINAETKPRFFRMALSSLILLIIASTAVLTYLNVFLVFFSILLYDFFARRNSFHIASFRTRQAITYWSVAFLGLLWLAVLFRRLFWLAEHKELYYGGQKNFFDDTVGSLVDGTLYLAHHSVDEVIGVKLFILLAFFGIIVYQLLCKKPSRLLRYLTLVVVLLIIAAVLQHDAMKALYNIGRTALAFVVIFSMLIIAAGAEMLKKAPRKLAPVVSGTLIAIGLACVLNFVVNVNTNRCYDWYSDVHNREILEAIKSNSKGLEKRVTFSSHWFNTLSLAYYIRRDNYNIQLAKLDGTTDNDFVYVPDDDPIVSSLAGYRKIARFKNPDATLFRKNCESVAITTYDDQYLCADYESGESLVANRTYRNTWETFSMIRSDSNKIILRSYTGKFVSANLDSDARITSNRDKPDLWETFTVINFDNGYSALKAFNGKYLSLNPTTRLIYATAETIGETEKFKLQVLH